jgi:hypothetical protein
MITLQNRKRSYGNFAKQGFADAIQKKFQQAKEKQSDNPEEQL